MLLPLLMTIEQARKGISTCIKSIYDKDETNNIAEIVLEHITGLSRIEILLNKNFILSTDQKESLTRITIRLMNHEPVQYIMNEAWFGEMKFYVDENVLIPRPETEELVDWIIKDFKIPDRPGHPGGQNSRPTGPSGRAKYKILDIGTGSGCIAITLKNKLPSIEMWACDISDEALTVARMNADTLKATIDFVPLNFLDADQRRQLPQFDIIVSNPPYVPKNEKLKMKKNVADFEPSVALFVPDNDPLIFYKAIAEFGKERLSHQGKIYIEIHQELGEQVKTLFYSIGYRFVELKKDMQGKDRMIKAIN